MAYFSNPEHEPIRVQKLNALEERVTAVEGAGGGGDLLAANNLSDLDNVATARTNLGLGTAALLASTALASSGLATASGLTMATDTIIYRKTAGTGALETQTVATLKTDLGLTGTNSGDQTSIVGITGSLAEFNAALTGADFATGGGTVTGASSGTNTGDQTSVTGNAGTATALQTPRNINGVAFDGTGNITISAVDSTARVPETRTISTTAPLTGGGDLSANRTLAISAATSGAAGSMSAADKVKADASLSAVKYDATGAALGAGIADYFTSSISLEAASTYEITCHAYFLKTTAGTVIWTWAFSSAPIMATSRYQSTPITGFTTTTITGAEIFSEATVEAATTMAHAVSGSLTTAVRHSFLFMAVVRTNAATTIQLRCTESAGTVTPQQGSYMRARKIV